VLKALHLLFAFHVFTFEELDLNFMARVYPFRALRYNPSLVRLEDVVTQPYDKITPAMQQAYYQRSPYNLVRIILGLPELFDSEQGEGDTDIYARAARDFRDWRKSGILSQESEPAIFAYSQRFSVPGKPGTAQERRGLIALGELSEYDEKVVFRHEQTLSKPKSDRLNLLRATRAHFGQIFMLYSDPGLSVERLLFQSTAAPDIEVTDEYEVSHRIWRVNDPGIINLITTALEDKKLIIADGHHRYETALNYAREHAPQKSVAQAERNTYALPQPPYPEAAVMMTFVNMDAEGLVILPTHRVVYGLKSFSPEDFLKRAQAYFDIRQLTGTGPSELIAELDAVNARTAFVCVTATGCSLLTAKAEAASKALEKLSSRQRQLDVVQLHALVLEELLGLTPEAIREQTNLRYLRDAAEAIAQVQEHDADAAFLMKPVTLDQLREVAFAGEVMPQKSTDFFPKLLSGLTVYALD
jgi:uncharacterized protein (DUF1015 family)